MTEDEPRDQMSAETREFLGDLSRDYSHPQFRPDWA